MMLLSHSQPAFMKGRKRAAMMRSIQILIVIIAFALGFVRPGFGQNAECEAEVRAACAQGGCPGTIVRDLYSRCMLNGPRSGGVQTNPAACEQEVRARCAQGGCPGIIVRDLYSRCMLNGPSGVGGSGATTPPGITPGSTPCGGGEWCPPGTYCIPVNADGRGGCARR